jgi:hypothetical protein
MSLLEPVVGENLPPRFGLQSVPLMSLDFVGQFVDCHKRRLHHPHPTLEMVAELDVALSLALGLA